MPRAYRLQSSFTRGVLDPALIARTDVEAYYQGIAEGENIIPLVQGGFSRRPGLEFQSEVAATTDHIRIIPFSFNTEQDYIIALTDSAAKIYKDGALVYSGAAPWSGEDLPGIRYAQTADTMILVHPDYQPRRLVRGANDSSWTLGVLTITNIPQFDFNDGDSPTGTDEIQDLDLVTILKGDDFIIKLEGFASSIITHAGNTNDDQKDETERLITEGLLSMGNTPNSGISVAYQSANIWRITFTDAAADDWPEVVVQEVNTGTGIGAVTVVQDGVPRTEDIISATRGWFRSVTFHEGRLWFGGTRQLPQTMLGSVVGDFFNFDLGTGLDDEAIQVTLDTDQVNAIQSLYSGRDLYVFTTGGEFIANAPERGTLTPGSINVRRNTRHGSGDVAPLSIDGAVLFVERSGKVLREFFFDFAEDSYSASMVSLFSSSLIKNPVDMAALRGTANEQSNYVYLVNSDGTVAVVNILREQSILSWVPWTTRGNFRSVAVIGDETYFIVERDGDFLLEKLNPDLYVDAGIIATRTAGDSSITSPDYDRITTSTTHLEGETLQVLADRSVQTEVEQDTGVILFDGDGAEEAQAGLSYAVRVLTMPLNVDFQNGPTLTRRKRIIEASLNVLSTRGLIVDNRELPDRTLDQDDFDSAPPAFTGLKQIYVHGWTSLAQIEIRQDDPLPMTILGLTLEVSLT